MVNNGHYGHPRDTSDPGISRMSGMTEKTRVADYRNVYIHFHVSRGSTELATFRGKLTNNRGQLAILTGKVKLPQKGGWDRSVQGWPE